jgi:GTP-binding protein EngB required for normal cell division/ribosomal protein S27E
VSRHHHSSKSRDASPERHSSSSKHHHHSSKSRDASPERHAVSKHHSSRHHHYSHSASVRSRDVSPERHHHHSSSRHHHHSHSASTRSRETSPERNHHSSSRHHSKSRDTSPVHNYYGGKHHHQESRPHNRHHHVSKHHHHHHSKSRDASPTRGDSDDVDQMPPSAESTTLTQRRLSHSKDTGSLEMKAPTALSGKTVSALKHGRASSGPSIAQRDQYLGECLMRDTHHLVHQFFEAYHEVADDLDRPNVLVAGITGAGKSSLINSVFGADLAATGSGSPVTQGFAEYSLPEVPVRIFDSKGLETGQHEEFLAMTARFFEEHQQLISAGGKARVHDMIHAIWYIVSASAARFHPFERDLISSGLFGRVPLFVLLSKCDIATAEQVSSVRSAIESANFPNLVGIFETVSADHTADKVITKCPACGSTELLVSTRSMIALCESCGQSHKASLPTGLEQVIEMTHDAIPAVVREAFISAQSVSFSLKNARAHRIISDFAAEAGHVHLSGTLVRSIAKMLTRLSILWNFRQYGHLYGTRIAKDVVHHMNFRDKLFVFVHKNHDHVNRSIALGYLWCGCVRQLAAEALNTSILFAGRPSPAGSSAAAKADAEAEAAKELDQHWNRILELCFADLNDENIMLTEHRIEREGIASMLEEAFPTSATGRSAVPPRVASPNTLAAASAIAATAAASGANAITTVTSVVNGDGASASTGSCPTSASQPLMFSTVNSTASNAPLHMIASSSSATAVTGMTVPQPVATPPPQTVIASVTKLGRSNLESERSNLHSASIS